MNKQIEMGQEVYLAMLESPHTGARVHAVSPDVDAAALECFMKALGEIPKKEWTKHTEAITVWRVFPYAFSFPMQQVDAYKSNDEFLPIIPAGGEAEKLGVALVSFLPVEETGQPLRFQYKFLRAAQRRVHGTLAN
jgi:hypothetical protein